MERETGHPDAVMLEAVCTVLGQLAGNRAKGEFLLAEIEKHPETLVRYIKQCYHPLRQYDHRMRAAVPHELMAKVFERADAGGLPPPTTTAITNADPARLVIEITTKPTPGYEDNGWFGAMSYDGARVGRVIIFSGQPTKQALNLLRQLGLTIVFPRELR